MTDHLYSLSHCHLFCLAGLVEYVPAIWKITSSHEGFSTVSSRAGVPPGVRLSHVWYGTPSSKGVLDN